MKKRKKLSEIGLGWTGRAVLGVIAFMGILTLGVSLTGSGSHALAADKIADSQTNTTGPTKSVTAPQGSFRLPAAPVVSGPVTPAVGIRSHTGFAVTSIAAALNSFKYRFNVELKTANGYVKKATQQRDGFQRTVNTEKNAADKVLGLAQRYVTRVDNAFTAFVDSALISEEVKTALGDARQSWKDTAQGRVDDFKDEIETYKTGLDGMVSVDPPSPSQELINITTKYADDMKAYKDENIATAEIASIEDVDALEAARPLAATMMALVSGIDRGEAPTPPAGQNLQWTEFDKTGLLSDVGTAFDIVVTPAEAVLQDAYTTYRDASSAYSDAERDTKRKRQLYDHLNALLMDGNAVPSEVEEARLAYEEAKVVSNAALISKNDAVTALNSARKIRNDLVNLKTKSVKSLKGIIAPPKPRSALRTPYPNLGLG